MVEHLARAAAELHQKRTGKRITDQGLLKSPPVNTQEVFHYNKDISSPASAKRKDSTTSTQASAVAWTKEEQQKFQEAVRKVGTSDPANIAKLMGNNCTETQVREYLRNAANLEKGDGAARRGGRGRKPPTTAMNTVPNANLDAKSMLGGRRLGL